jgi:hypothetical protein
VEPSYPCPLDEDVRKALIHMIDTMLTKKRMRELPEVKPAR